MGVVVVLSRLCSMMLLCPISMCMGVVESESISKGWGVQWSPNQEIGIEGPRNDVQPSD